MKNSALFVLIVPMTLSTANGQTVPDCMTPDATGYIHVKYLPCPLPSSLSGIVTVVADGDTVVLQTTGVEKFRLRLAEIDAPEHDQPGGTESRMSLVALTQDKQATVYPLTIDPYGRMVARIFVGSIDVNAEQVKRGMAWAYIQFLTSKNLLDFQQQAQEASLGLWSGPTDGIIPPWRWRTDRKEAVINSIKPCSP